MKVILLQNIKGVGQIGDIMNVSDGHARNFLFPRKLAKVANAVTLKEAEGLQKKREAMNLKDAENAKKAVATLAETKLKFQKKASSTGKLFSSVTKQEIANELTRRAGITVAVNMLDLGNHGEHIKKTGDHIISVQLANDLKADVRISVKAE